MKNWSKSTGQPELYSRELADLVSAPSETESGGGAGQLLRLEPENSNRDCGIRILRIYMKKKHLIISNRD
jgi:hypothetical protein